MSEESAVAAPAPARRKVAGRVKREVITVDDGNGPVDVEIRGLTLAKRHEIQDRSSVQGDNISDRKIVWSMFFPDVLRACCFYPGTEERMFAEDNDETLNDMHHESAQALIGKALELSGMSAAEGKNPGNGALGIPIGISDTPSPSDSTAPSTS